MSRSKKMPAAVSPVLVGFLRRLPRWGLGTRLCLVPIAIWMQDVLFIVMSLGCAALFILASVFVRKKYWNALIFLYGFELSILLTGLLYLFGWASGFHIHVFLLVIGVLMFDHLRIRQRIALAVAPVVGFAIILPALAYVGPRYVLPQAWSMTLYVMNFVVFIICIGAIIQYFTQTIFDAKREAEVQGAARGRLITDMSHEFKMPLTSMMLKIQATMKHGGEAEQREALNFCERGVRSMSALSHRMLDLMADDVAGLEPSRVQVDVCKLVRDSTALHEPVSEVKHIALKVNAEGSVFVVSDPVYLQTAISNLLANAIRHSLEQSVVSVSVDTLEDSVRITVADCGTGIEAEDLPHIFEPFYRTDKARSRAEGSVGLGLSIAREYVRRLGGEVEVHSQPGRGAAFAITIPRNA